MIAHFLAGRRLAVVGASDDVGAVNPNADRVAGDVCYDDLGSLPGHLDGVVVMVGPAHSADVVKACAARGVDRVWLFKGIGGAGAVSAEAVRLCAVNGIDVVAGACPLMFLEPVGWFHRLHRGARRANSSHERAA